MKEKMNIPQTRCSVSGILIFFLFMCLVFFEFKANAYSKWEKTVNDNIKERTTSPQDPVKEGIVSENEKLTDEEGKYLLEVARRTIEQRLFKKDDIDQDDSALSSRLLERRGTFVTLTIKKGLRGCIGHIIPQEALIEGIRENALNAAFRDPRFRPLSRSEWEDVRVEISILTEPMPLEYSDANDLLAKLRPGIDGVILKQGFRQATFLPQVWDQLPDKKEFLTHLCLKAGMNGHAWEKEDIEVLTYQVQAFEEEQED